MKFSSNSNYKRTLSATEVQSNDIITLVNIQCQPDVESYVEQGTSLNLDLEL